MNSASARVGTPITDEQVRDLRDLRAAIVLRQSLVRGTPAYDAALAAEERLAHRIRDWAWARRLRPI